MPSFSPPQAVRAAARRGLEMRRANGGKGGLDASEAAAQGIGSGVVRAQTLASGKSIPLETVKRMHSFFARHEKNKHGPNGKVAWALWGGDAGKRWADSIVAQHTEKSMEKAMNAHQKKVAREVHGDEVSSSVPGHSEEETSSPAIPDRMVQANPRVLEQGHDTPMHDPITQQKLQTLGEESDGLAIGHRTGLPGASTMADQQYAAGSPGPGRLEGEYDPTQHIALVIARINSGMDTMLHMHKSQYDVNVDLLKSAQDGDLEKGWDKTSRNIMAGSAAALAGLVGGAAYTNHYNATRPERERQERIEFHERMANRRMHPVKTHGDADFMNPTERERDNRRASQNMSRPDGGRSISDREIAALHGPNGPPTPTIGAGTFPTAAQSAKPKKPVSSKAAIKSTQDDDLEKAGGFKKLAAGVAAAGLMTGAAMRHEQDRQIVAPHARAAEVTGKQKRNLLNLKARQGQAGVNRHVAVNKLAHESAKVGTGEVVLPKKVAKAEGGAAQPIFQKGKLTSEERSELDSGDFVFPEDRSYPIHDESHARNALARVSQHGSAEEKVKVRAAVHRKYPHIAQEHGKKKHLAKSIAEFLINDAVGSRRGNIRRSYVDKFPNAVAVLEYQLSKALSGQAKLQDINVTQADLLDATKALTGRDLTKSADNVLRRRAEDTLASRMDAPEDLLYVRRVMKHGV